MGNGQKVGGAGFHQAVCSVEACSSLFRSIYQTDEEEEYAFECAEKIADRFDADAHLTRPKPHPATLAQKMHAHAMPRQLAMPRDAPCGYPCFQAQGAERRICLEAESVLHLLVRDRGHFPGGNIRGTGLLYAGTAERRA